MSVVKLKTTNASESARLAHFYGPPSWPDLSSKVAEMFGVPLQDVCFAYVDKARVSVTLRNDQDLQHFYQSLESSEEIKLVVQDLRAPDGESAFKHLLPGPCSSPQPAPSKIVSIWSADSIPDLGKHSLTDNIQTLNHWFR